MKKETTAEHFEKLAAFLSLKKKIGVDEKINLYDFLTSIDGILEVENPSKKKNNWQATITNAKILDQMDSSPKSLFGNGNTSNLAIEDCLIKIRGKVLKIKSKYYPISNGLYFQEQKK